MAKRRTRQKKISLDDLPQALQDLDVNVPYYNARLVGNRIELHLYGGRVVRWPADPDLTGLPSQPVRSDEEE